jgi:aryl-alcohol dehydrogenase-like predicted oxidoreductase
MTGVAELVLGTAQLALPYGKLAPEPAPDRESSFEILDCAWQAGIRAFDTATAYGEAEVRIGAWSRDRRVAPRIIGKIPAIPELHKSPAEFTAAHVHGACERLGRSYIDVMLLHRATDIRLRGAIDALCAAARSERVGRWGVSVYTKDEFAEALDVPGLGAIEAPINVLDRRIEVTGLILQAASRGIEVIARSIFLQGALLRPPESIPLSIPGLRNVCVKFSKIAASLGMDRGMLAISCVRSMSGISKVVVGAASAGQMKEIAKWSSAMLGETAIPALESLGAGLNEQALDPRNWQVDLERPQPQP